jgi:hypothetical protein
MATIPTKNWRFDKWGVMAISWMLNFAAAENGAAGHNRKHSKYGPNSGGKVIQSVCVDEKGTKTLMVRILKCSVRRGMADFFYEICAGLP